MDSRTRVPARPSRKAPWNRSTNSPRYWPKPCLGDPCVIRKGLLMNLSRTALAALGAFVAYFVVGGLMAALPSLRNEFLKYPTVYRSKEAMKSVMPAGMAAMFLAMLVLAVIYAMLYQGG